MAGNFSSLGLSGSAIKSIQRGVSATGTVTISSVSTSKSEVRLLGSTTGSTYISLTSSTQITTGGSAGTFSWEVTERY